MIILMNPTRLFWQFLFCQNSKRGELYNLFILKFIYSEKATKFCEISTVDLTVTTQDKSKVEILQKFVAFSEYMNFTHPNLCVYEKKT